MVTRLANSPPPKLSPCHTFSLSPLLILLANSPLSLPTYCALSSCCWGLLSPFPHGTLHEQPGRAVWVASVGCVRCPPLPSHPMSSTCNPSSIKPQAVLTLSAQHPSQVTSVPPWLPRWGRS